jgi:hypothetical protein
MILQDVFQSFDFERTWRYSGMFFNLLTERTWRYSRTFFNLITLSLPDVTPEGFSIFWLWAYLMLLQDVFQSLEFERTWRYFRMFFNLLTLSISDVTPGCVSIFWLLACLTLLQDVFQSVDFERTRRYSRMFFNLLTLSVPDVTPGCFSIFWLWKTYWSNVRDAQSQKIEKHPGVTSGTLKVKRLKNILLLTLSVPDVTPGYFSFFWLWAHLTLLRDVFQSSDFERTWRYSRMFFLYTSYSLHF